MERPKHNPDARDPEDVLGTTLPDTISAVSWNRPYKYLVVRTDEDRLSRLDDHPEGRVIISGFFTRHNAVGAKADCERRGSSTEEYIIAPEPNPGYEG